MMGKPAPAGEKTTFVGESQGGTHDEPVRLSEALAGLAEQIVIHSGEVTRETGPKWFRVTFIEVEIENQNVKTMRVGVSGTG